MGLSISDKKVYRTFEDYDLQDLQFYAGIDCITTSSLLSRLAPELMDRPEYLRSEDGRLRKTRLMSIWESMERYEMPAFEFICDMELNGIKYDVAKNRAMNARMETEIGELEDRIFTNLGIELDLNSGTAMSKFLYEDRGFPILGRTQKGEPSTDGDTLKELAAQTGLEWLEWIGKRNDINSVNNTFVKTYVDDFVKRDGRLHPRYNLHGTSSFRITGEEPNLTQLPRPKHGYNVRSCYTVENGNVFLALDFSSAEVKVLGALCKDPTLLAAIRDGKDFHSVSASAMHGISYDEYVHVLEEGERAKAERREPPAEYKKYKQWRQDAKALTFGINE